jgi:predicted Rdx family selenoprotein
MSFNSRTIKSPAVLAAEQRRIQRAAVDSARTEWFINEACQQVNLSLKKRIKVAVAFLQSKIVVNISRPVTKTLTSRKVTSINPDTGRKRTRTIHEVQISNRSKPGEFPKADTTLLLKTIFSVVVEPQTGIIDGFVGTPLEYGLHLELYKDRSFLRRTFNEEVSRIIKVLTGPIETPSQVLIT